MRQFRILFAFCALALLAPLVFLVRQAVYSVALERQMRHQAVAERVFDEMERNLSEILDREEARSFPDFVTAARSDEPFVLGTFQVDPKGTIAAWAGPRSTGRSAAREIERLVAGHWRAPADAAPKPVAGAAQNPGTTVALRDAELGAGRAPAKQSESVDAYDALRSLNKAASERSERQARLQAPAPSVRVKESDERREVAGESDLAARPRSPVDHSFAAPDPSAHPPAQVELSPMSGRLVDSGHLILYRSAVREAELFRQGVVLNLDQLGGWLRERALAGEGFERYADVTFWTLPASPPALGTDRPYVYQHRFAEPFDDLSARLMLAALPGIGSATYVYALSALLLAVGALGLVALYRMVSVTVGFAERRSNFVAAVSHELKTPLTAIRMYGEMLRDGLVASDAKRQEYYRHITVESERLSRLINNVLELGRLEKGGRNVTLSSAAVEPVLAEVAELLRPHVEREGFELTVEAEPDLPPVRFDRDALVQVLCNLVDNAVKYAHDATPRRIVLRAGRDGGAVCVAVRDHGPGVAARQLSRIFEPFYRIESELTRQRKGTGIGLALVRGLAEQMGGRVVGRNLTDGFEVALRFPAA